MPSAGVCQDGWDMSDSATVQGYSDSACYQSGSPAARPEGKKKAEPGCTVY